MFALTESFWNGKEMVFQRTHIFQSLSFEHAMQLIRNQAIQTGSEIINESLTSEGWAFEIKQDEPKDGEFILECKNFLRR